MLYLCRYIFLCALWMPCLTGTSYASAFSVEAATPGTRITSFCTHVSEVRSTLFLKDTIIGDQIAAIHLHAIENADLLDFKYAILLDKAVEEVRELPLFRFIKEWTGVPYSFGGNGKEGIDCSGFVQRLVSTLYNLPISRMVKTQFAECLPILRNELREGDLLFFHTTRPGLSHVGYYLGNNKFVHASTVRGVIIDDLCDRYYDKAFRHGGRLLPRNEQPSISANE